MFSVDVTKRGKGFGAVASALRGELERAADDAAHDVLKQARTNIQAMGAYDTGALYRSGHVEGQSAQTKRVVFDVEYALYVHEGHRTRGGSFVPGRPFLTKAMEESRSDIQARITDAVQRAAR
jgi:hypothetical protein